MNSYDNIKQKYKLADSTVMESNVNIHSSDEEIKVYLWTFHANHLSLSRYTFSYVLKHTDVLSKSVLFSNYYRCLFLFLPDKPYL